MAGTLIRMSGGRLPKRIVFGNLDGAMRRGRGRKEKEWTDCVQSDIRAFGITGDRKATALGAEVWVETVAEGGRRLMAAWSKEEIDAANIARRKERQRDWESYYRTRKRRILRSDTHWPSRRVEGNPCADARRTETCVAPWHVDASRGFYFILFSPNGQRAGGGGGGRFQSFSFSFSFFPFQQTTSGVGYRVKYNNNNNNNNFFPPDWGMLRRSRRVLIFL